MNTVVSTDLVDESAWHASLELSLAQRDAQTRLYRCRHKGPLYVQKAFYPEGEALAHLYLLHPPGGVVSGDHLAIDVEMENDAKALITTPGATRIYRARDFNPVQRQDVRLKIAPGSSLEWFPLETIIYNGACVQLNTQVELEGDSHFVGWEISCFGLPASNELFSQGSFLQRYRVFHNGVPVFVEGLHINEDNLKAQIEGSATLRGETSCGLFLAGPFREPLTEDDMDQLRNTTHTPQADLSQVGSFVVGRYLGDSAEQARKAFTHWWHALRPRLLGRPACPPRIWFT